MIEQNIFKYIQERTNGGEFVRDPRIANHTPCSPKSDLLPIFPQLCLPVWSLPVAMGDTDTGGSRR